jgi:hypothetical protein
MIGDIKHIYVIESLFDADAKTGEALYNDVIKRRIDGQQSAEMKMSHHFYNVSSKEQLTDYLRYIAFNAKFMRQGVLIHLEIHGSEDKSGLVLNNNSLITWEELAACFRQINIASLNHLYISLASCYGRFLFEGVDPNLKSPYSGYISASKEVMADEIIDNFSEMFEHLIQCGNLIEAYISATTEVTSFYYKDSKTIFNEIMEQTKYKIRHDPKYKEEVLGGDIFRNALASGLASQKDLDSLMYQAYRSIYRRHKQALEFNEEY